MSYAVAHLVEGGDDGRVELRARERVMIFRASTSGEAGLYGRSVVSASSVGDGEHARQRDVVGPELVRIALCRPTASWCERTTSRDRRGSRRRGIS
jgi:hypothetical protein